MKSVVYTTLLAVLFLSVSCHNHKNISSNESNLDPMGRGNSEQNVERSYDKDSELLDSLSKMPQTQIQFQEESFDFGTINKNKTVGHYYTFTNIGTEPAIISVKPGCGCTAPKFPKQAILPGKSDSILLEFNPTNFNDEVHKSAEVRGNIGKPIVIRFTANIK